MRPPLRAVPTLLVALLGLAVLAPGASAAPKTVIFNMYPAPLVQPERVFFQANSGPFMDKLVWSGWGSAQATATGTWTLDCSNGGGGCAPGDPSLAYPARYTVGDLAPCPRFGAGATSYRSGSIEVDRPEGTQTIPFGSDYDFCAKRPTRKAAIAAVTRYVEKRLHGRHVQVTCSVARDVDRECKATWKRSGKTKKREFDVSNRMTGGLLVFPLGS